MFSKSKKLDELEDVLWKHTQRLHEIDTKIKSCLETLDSLRGADASKLLGRVEALEMWRADLHSKIIEKSTLTGREHLTKLGKKILINPAVVPPRAP